MCVYTYKYKTCVRAYVRGSRAVRVCDRQGAADTAERSGSAAAGLGSAVRGRGSRAAPSTPAPAGPWTPFQQLSLSAEVKQWVYWIQRESRWKFGLVEVEFL